MWAGAQRTPSAVAGGNSEAGLMQPVARPRGMVCGVLVAMLQGEELGAHPVDRDMVNVGTVPVSPARGGQARCRLMAPERGGGSVVVRGRESRPHGEGTQQVSSVDVGMPGGRR